jgi:hypothetical protein
LLSYFPKQTINQTNKTVQQQQQCGLILGTETVRHCFWCVCLEAHVTPVPAHLGASAMAKGRLRKGKDCIVLFTAR